VDVVSNGSTEGKIRQRPCTWRDAASYPWKWGQWTFLAWCRCQICKQLLPIYYMQLQSVDKYIYWRVWQSWQLVTAVRDEGDGLSLCERLSWGYDCTHCRVTFNCCCGDFSATSSMIYWRVWANSPRSGMMIHPQ
jgi:hypothetical protein